MTSRRSTILSLVLAATILGLLAAVPGAQSPPAPNHKMECSYCHRVHGGTFMAQGEAAIEALCLSCHATDTNVGGKLAVKAIVHENSRSDYGAYKISCTGCHNPHASLATGTSPYATSGFGNVMLIGMKVREANSTDGLARLRRPKINDNGTTTGRTPFADDFQEGYYCASGIPDDPACVEASPPSSTDHIREVIFYTNAAPVNADSSDNQWAQPPGNSPWYNGACNSCHTRTTHHRRDDSGGDHTHNVNKACSDCHVHDRGWIK